ncbi:flippase activity-associated protein Agl23 [Halobellus rubicundus]|uniref:Flippase activity-associated protein Agl23 n=1 Tax=Halobellus rubicundus TaxID=2996466 RepID=A0ABD5MB63_9EURY
MSPEADAGNAAGSDGTPAPSGARLSVAGVGFRRDRVLAAVLAIAAVGLCFRLVALGARPFHWDEARVGYWTLRYLDTGAFQYRPVAGGPLLYHLGRASFALLGASEFTARLPVAVVGAGLPLAALLFRDRLNDAETVALALVLAFQPLVLYYGRFLRGDVLLAVFGLVAVGFAIRAWDRGSRRDAYAAALAIPLAASASGFVAGYLLCGLGAWLLVVDQRSVAADGGRSARATLAAVRGRLTGTVTSAARAALLSVGTAVFLFAPRAGPGVERGLYAPADFPYAIYEGTVGALWRFVGVRLVNRAPDGTHAFLPFVRDAAALLVAVALPVLVAGVAVTFLARYASPSRRRPLIEGAGYWGLLALFVFPTLAEVSAPWTLVHVVVPLSLPASVGFVALARRGIDAVPRSLGGAAAVDVGTAVAVALAFLAVGAQVGAVTAGGVYGPADRSNRLAQFAQPSDDLEPIEAAARAAADENRSTAEVVYVGESFHLLDDAMLRPPVGDAWGARLPLPWYVAVAGADATSAPSVSAFAERYGNGSAPPIVVADPAARAALADRLGDGYEATVYRLGLWNREVVVFTRRAAVRDRRLRGAGTTEPILPRPSGG